MMDYQSNSNKNKEEPKRPDKQVVKIVTGEVVQKQKTIGRKFKDVFLGGDLRVASRYVVGDVLLPALRNLIVDMTSKGVERIVYGESMYRRRPSEYRPRVQYNNPIYRDPRERRAILPDQPPHPYRQNRYEVNDVILSSRDEAEQVVEALIDIIDKYEVASLADFYELVGLPSSHIDNKWGWHLLNSAQVRQVREGYLIELPKMEEI